MNENRVAKRVAVGMSGGVDSSLAAALLKKSGYEVIGVMLRLWSESGREGSNRCCTPDAIAMARRVASRLDIPFYVVDAKSPFQSIVVEYFLDTYGAGATPNPCLECNKLIRWGVLREHAHALGADLLATGHYARVRHNSDGSAELLKAVDAAKDQSYVLHVLSQEQLRSTLLPVGELTKSQVREAARNLGLPSAGRPDSQDLCFLGGRDYRDFIRSHRPEMMHAGQMVGEGGDVVGSHEGLAGYTLGQRRGLGVVGSKPLFVVRKDVVRNRITLGPASSRYHAYLNTGVVNWLAGDLSAASFRADVKIRYSAQAAPAAVSIGPDGTSRVEFDEPQLDVTPGQAAVFYSGEKVLGGGRIVEELG